MAVTSATRMPVDHLTVDHLSNFPIWEYCQDEDAFQEQDETWVHPVIAKSIPAEAWSLQVAATFTLCDGSRHDGFVDITTALIDDAVTLPDRMISEQPDAIIILGGKQYYIAKEESFDFAQTRRALVAALARHLTSIFPIAYELKVLVEGEQECRQGLLR